MIHQTCSLFSCFPPSLFIFVLLLEVPLVTIPIMNAIFVGFLVAYMSL